jgi:hypothetical protein
MDAAAVEDNVPDADPDSKLNPGMRRHLRIPLNHTPLDVDRTAHRVNHAREENQQPVPGRPYDPASMFLDFGVDEGVMVSVQSIERAFVVNTY